MECHLCLRSKNRLRWSYLAWGFNLPILLSWPSKLQSFSRWLLDAIMWEGVREWGWFRAAGTLHPFGSNGDEVRTPLNTTQAWSPPQTLIHVLWFSNRLGFFTTRHAGNLWKLEPSLSRFKHSKIARMSFISIIKIVDKIQLLTPWTYI